MNIYKISNKYYERILHTKWCNPISALLARVDNHCFKEGDIWTIQAYCGECKKKYKKPIKVKITYTKKIVANKLTEEDCVKLGIYNKEEVEKKRTKSYYNMFSRFAGINDWCGQPWGSDAVMALPVIVQKDGFGKPEKMLDANVSIGYFEVIK